MVGELETAKVPPIINGASLRAGNPDRQHGNAVAKIG
jgi:hypothetical protein